MAEERVRSEAGRLGRILGRGRSQATPFYLHLGVIAVLAVVVGVLVAIAFLVLWLA